MRLYTVERPRGTVPLGALLLAGLLVLPLGAWFLEQGYFDFGVCGMKQLTGLPCLSCGATRATMALLGGNILGAVSLQPLIISIYLLIGGWGLASFGTFLQDRKLILDMTPGEDFWFKVSLVALPVLNWFYLIWQGI